MFKSKIEFKNLIYFCCCLEIHHILQFVPSPGDG